MVVVGVGTIGQTHTHAHTQQQHSLGGFFDVVLQSQGQARQGNLSIGMGYSGPQLGAAGLWIDVHWPGLVAWHRPPAPPDSTETTLPLPDPASH